MNIDARLDTILHMDAGQKKALVRLKIETVGDLLFHFPLRYSDMSVVKNISELSPGDMATVYGKVSKLKTKKSFRSGIPMAEGEVADLSGKIKITWFNQAYLAKMIKNGESVKLTGKVTESKNGMYLANPEFEKLPAMPIDSHDTLFRKPASFPFAMPESDLSYSVYAETKGITSKWFYHAIEKILSAKGRPASGGKEVRFLDT